jgi:hypothetical protein
MSGFFIGQRVRIRWSLTWPDLNGQTGRITAKISDAQRRYLPAGHSGQWEVAPDAWGGSASPDGLGFFFPASEQLDPLTPEGMHPAEWADCAWQPASVVDETAPVKASLATAGVPCRTSDST